MVIVDTNCLQTFLRFSYSSDTSVLMYRLVFMTENNDSNDAFKSVFFWGGGCDIFPLNFSNLDCVYSASLTKPFHDLTSLHKYEIILTFNSCLVLSFGLNRFWSRDQPSLTTFKRYYYLFLFISYRMATWNKTSPTLFKNLLIITII